MKKKWLVWIANNHDVDESNSCGIQLHIHIFGVVQNKVCDESSVPTLRINNMTSLSEVLNMRKRRGHLFWTSLLGSKQSKC